ncbi:hypothetical protein CW696_03195 [ANME-2 cluster archaeon]|nr:MAG: hypothetical protein CW696_03195 [ANME-2 cluster archaeon]
MSIGTTQVDKRRRCIIVEIIDPCYDHFGDEVQEKLVDQIADALDKLGSDVNCPALKGRDLSFQFSLRSWFSMRRLISGTDDDRLVDSSPLKHLRACSKTFRSLIPPRVKASGLHWRRSVTIRKRYSLQGYRPRSAERASGMIAAEP